MMPPMPKPAMHDAGDRGARFAAGVQQRRQMGKQAVHEHGFEKHRAEADLGQRIAEDRAVVRAD